MSPSSPIERFRQLLEEADFRVTEGPDGRLQVEPIGEAEPTFPDRPVVPRQDATFKCRWRRRWVNARRWWWHASRGNLRAMRQAQELFDRLGGEKPLYGGAVPTRPDLSSDKSGGGDGNS